MVLHLLSCRLAISKDLVIVVHSLASRDATASDRHCGQICSSADDQILTPVSPPDIYELMHAHDQLWLITAACPKSIVDTCRKLLHLTTVLPDCF